MSPHALSYDVVLRSLQHFKQTRASDVLQTVSVSVQAVQDGLVLDVSQAT